MMDYLATLEQMNRAMGMFAAFVMGMAAGTALGIILLRLMDWMTDRK